MFIALASPARAIIASRTGKGNDVTADEFIQDLRQRVLGAPEISTDGYRPYQAAIRDSLRMGAEFTRLTNAFSKTLPNYVAGVSLYVAHYNAFMKHYGPRQPLRSVSPIGSERSAI